MSQPVTLETRDQVAWITIDRQAKRNAIDERTLEALGRAVATVQKDDAVRVVALRGAGPCFSAGIDLSWLASGADLVDVAQDEGRRLRRLIDWIQRGLERLEQLEKPTIAAIDGFCGGLGLELALCCDFRLATEGAMLGLPEILFGLIPDCGGSTRLTRIAGVARAKQLIMTGEMIPAREAERYSIVHRVVPAGALQAEVARWAEKLIARPAAAVGLAKQLVDFGFGLDRRTHQQLEALTQSVLMSSPHFGQYVAGGLEQLRQRRAQRDE